MPKNSGAFPDRIDLAIPREARAELIAVAYHMGAKGVYAVPAREFIIRGLEKYRKSLTGRAKGDFEEILGNVRIQLGDLPEVK